MSVRIGDNGGIRVAPESTYGTAGTVWAVQHARSGPLGLRRPLLPAPRLGAAQPAVRKYGVPYADGEISLAYDDSRAIIGNILANAGNLTVNDYTIGDGSAPDTNALTIWVDYGGYALRYVGAKIQTLRFEFQPDSPIVVTAAYLAQSVSEQTVTALTAPDETGIVWESDISAITVGGAAMCALQGSIEVQLPLVGSDRHCLGAGTIKEPQYAGRPTITASLQCELADDTGADTEAQLADFLSGTALGDIVIGDFTLSNCYMTGDTPALGEGITSIPINAEGNELVITTTA